MNQSDSAPFGMPRSELELWRTEVREFCEDALRQLQQLTDMLECELTEQPRASIDTDTVMRMETQTLVVPPPPPAPSADDGVDSSRSRLENLKRQLSEKLRQSDSDSQDPRYRRET